MRERTAGLSGNVSQPDFAEQVTRPVIAGVSTVRGLTADRFVIDISR